MAGSDFDDVNFFGVGGRDGAPAQKKAFFSKIRERIFNLLRLIWCSIRKNIGAD